MTERANKMAIMPIKKLVMSMAVPAMISMVIQAMYNVVDSIYVSRISEEALTAVSLAFPLQLVIIALVAGTSAGVTSLISRRLGEQDRESASKAASHGYMINIFYSLLMVIVGLFFARSAVAIFTDDLYLIELTTQYISIVMIFSFGRFIAQAGIGILQATGDMIHPMKGMLIGAISNIILDPIFIFGLFGVPAMGIRGAAYATVAGQILSFVYIGLVIRNGRHEVDIKIRGFKPEKKIFRDIYVVALPAIIMQSLGSVMLTGLNLILISFTPTAVAVLGVYYKLQSLIIMPVFGLAQGYMPIMGYNFGAKNKERMLESLKFTLKIAFIIMAVGTSSMVIFPKPLLLLFDASEDMIGIGVKALRTVSLCLPIAAAGITFSITFQAIGKGYASLVSSFIRQIVFLLPAAWLLSKGFGLQAVWYAFLIAEIGAIMIIAPWLMRELTKTFKAWEDEKVFLRETL
ncbi:MAG: MATE family efflux transporter [Tissierellales bacterium]|nr:MATE family efflux transporter [Tissierellales bacterium]MBN2828380.1 MATE family efflux transporter [Tissierellales bacterium]